MTTPHAPSALDANIVQEASDLISTFVDAGCPLPKSFRWPIIDELTGIASNLHAFAEHVEHASADRFAAVANALLDAGVGADKVASVTRSVIAALAVTPAATPDAAAAAAASSDAQPAEARAA